MRAVGIAALILAMTISGWAMELARPVFFSDEPVTLLTSPDAPTPKLEFCGKPYSVEWTSRRVAEGLRWEGHLPLDAPLGVWIASLPGECVSFLRISTDWAVLELAGAAGAEVEAGGLSIVPIPEETLVMGAAGEWELSYRFPGQRAPHPLRVSLAPHEWQRILIGRLDLIPSSPVVLPNREFLLKAVVLSPLDVPALDGALELPAGWTATLAVCAACPPEMPEPIPAGVLTTRAWRIRVPEDAPLGSYPVRVTLPSTHITGSLEVEVVNRLPVEVVVAHWDTETGQLDLTMDPGITYDQLLWATSLLGKEVPFSGRVLTQEMLDRLAAFWQAGG